MISPTNSLERALILIETIGRAPAGLTNGESSRLLRIPRSTCSYIMKRLERNGYLTRDAETGRYKVGLAVVALAYGALRDMGLRSIGEPALYKLACETGLSANIGVLDRGRVLLVDRVESPKFVERIVDAATEPPTAPVPSEKMSTTEAIRLRNERDIGRELPADASALGEVLLAHLSKAELLNMIRQYGLSRFRTSKASMEQLTTELVQVRKQGYAASYGNYEKGVCAIAAPIVDQCGMVRAAVSINGFPSEADWSDPGELVEQVKAAGRDISRRARQWANVESCLEVGRNSAMS